MSILSESNKAINALNELFPLLKSGAQRDKYLSERKKLNDQASELAHKSLINYGPELNNAIDALTKVTESANKAKKSIEETGGNINKVADTIDKIAAAVAALASFIAIL
ncbi:hypothetical protein [Aeromonas sp. 600282]|uniref:hypothetical protein n=1 Tax=Aeromonas sp. 600282 TaxID=2712027 RepID=UPI003B9EE079